MRLNDLKADLEEGDTSIAPILMRADEETEVRNFVGVGAGTGREGAFRFRRKRSWLTRSDPISGSSGSASTRRYRLS